MITAIDSSVLLDDFHIEFEPSTMHTAICGGEYFDTYVHRKGAQKRVVADFLIGAHAVIHADRLLARDRGYLRDYFKNLKVINPAAN